ncbi:MAG: BrxA/BrxB family bacilliredoxin [Bacteroidota bacterium]
MYPEHLVAPMRQELVNAGFKELKTADDVDKVLTPDSGNVLLVFNSVCGCAAGTARPGVKLALQRTPEGERPDTLVTAFAGVDTAAVIRARELTAPYPPSSPAIALFQNGELVHFVERHHIEGRSAEVIAQHLSGVFEEFCGKAA